MIDVYLFISFCVVAVIVSIVVIVISCFVYYIYLNYKNFRQHNRADENSRNAPFSKMESIVDKNRSYATINSSSLLSNEDVTNIPIPV